MEAVDDLPPDIAVGGYLVAEQDGEEVVWRVTDIADGKAVLDGNHELAGQRLRFDATVVDVRPATRRRDRARPRARRARPPPLNAGRITPMARAPARAIVFLSAPGIAWTAPLGWWNGACSWRSSPPPWWPHMVLSRGAPTPSMRAALGWSVVWIGLGLGIRGVDRVAPRQRSGRVVRHRVPAREVAFGRQPFPLPADLRENGHSFHAAATGALVGRGRRAGRCAHC